MIYLDSAATTKPAVKVIDEVKECMTNIWGNPSSPHVIGRRAKMILEESREKIAATINADPDQIIFTSGGTEANNIVLQGIGRYIYVSSIEHHSILNEDICSTKIPVNKSGIVISKFLEETLDNDGLVSIMMTNNEIGTVQNIKELAEITHEHKGLFHTDAVAAYGHQLIDVKYLDIDFMTVSGHKWGAPKGVGFLYVKKKEDLFFPLEYGGKQEFRLRPGTENAAYIYAMANRAKELYDSKSYAYNWVFSDMRTRLIEELQYVNGFNMNSPVKGQPNILNFRIDGIDSQQLIAMLDERGFCVSAGSACTSGLATPSHVLRAIGLTEEQAKSSIRVSFDFDTKLHDLILFAEAVKRCVSALRY